VVARPSRAYVVAGAPATGKSTLGAALARRVGAAPLDQDVLTGALTAVVAALIRAEPGDLDDPRVHSLTRRARYDTLVDTAAGCLAAGVPVVVVAPFTVERRDPAAWQRLVRRLDAPGGVVLVWTTCPPDELARRLASRGAARDRRKLADFQGFLASPTVAPPRVAHLPVDTTSALEVQVRSVLRVLPEDQHPTPSTPMSLAIIDPPAPRRSAC
jgi:predicted kinase